MTPVPTTSASYDRSRIGQFVDRERQAIVDLCLELGNLPDLCGNELAVAAALADAYRADGFHARLQHLSSTSANLVVTVPGAAADDPSATSLMLNSHLDTEGSIPPGPDQEVRELRGTWLDGETLIGKGLINAKAHLVAQLFAARALRGCEVELRGDLVLTASAQETGTAAAPGQWAADGWSGPHVQEGVGARWLVDHGVLADFALVGEPTGLAICQAQAGYLRLRVEVAGVVPYTPFVSRGSGSGPPVTANPFESAAPVITAISEWAASYEERAAVDVDGGRLVPKAQIQAILAGTAAFTERADVCEIFVDVRTAPGADALAVQRELARHVKPTGPVVAVECFDHRRGYIARNAGRLVAAVGDAHREVFGADPPPPPPPQISMWQDTNAFNEVGIPSVSYGIRPVAEPHTRERIRGLHIDDLIALVKVYALASIKICGGDGR